MYYKVVTSNLKSCVEERYTIQYKVNEWVAARLGKLFIFKSLEAARGYVLTSDDSLMIFSCEAKNVITAHLMGIPYAASMYEYFWNNFDETKYGCIPPPGTLYADEVMLLERVW